MQACWALWNIVCFYASLWGGPITGVFLSVLLGMILLSWGAVWIRRDSRLRVVDSIPVGSLKLNFDGPWFYGHSECHKNVLWPCGWSILLFSWFWISYLGWTTFYGSLIEVFAWSYRKWQWKGIQSVFSFQYFKGRGGSGNQLLHCSSP